MELQFSSYRGVSLDQVRSSFSFLQSSFFSDDKVFRDKILFSVSCFSFYRRKKEKPFSGIKCFLVENGLIKRPKPELLRSGIDERRENCVEKSSPRLCGNIEILVSYGRYRQALEVFEILETKGGCDVGRSTYDALVKACIGLSSTKAVKIVFNHMLRTGFAMDQYIWNRVLLMHVRCGMMRIARKLFDEMPKRNLISWNTMISGLVDSGDYVGAFCLFLTKWEEFSEVGSWIFANMVRASAGLGAVFVGRQLHSCVLKMGVSEVVYVSCPLIDMYSKCGCMEDARRVFDQMPVQTAVGWNCIISGYALNGYSEEALSICYEMRDSGVNMDHFIPSTILRICTKLELVELAKQAHACLIRHGFGLNTVANTLLVDFYGKSGRVENAQYVFDRLPRKNVVTWNALIGGYANNGQGAKAVEMFEQMLCEGTRPDHITFLAVLSGCSYSGLSERGWKFFESMSRVHGIKPRAMHYACMIELLGREGFLDLAFEVVGGAPLQPTLNMWAALLTACRVHKNLELGKFAAEKLCEMESIKLGNYVVLFNVYNSSGKLKEAASVLQTLERKGLRMLPACTWIEIRKRPHIFHTGDTRHAQTSEIYQRVHELIVEISKHGYVPEKKFFLPDVDELEQQRVVSYHGEKLAVAFGLISTSDATQLQIMQRHRICDDCHNALKLIALVTKREIVARDASRFHHFRDGGCSCGDYW